MPFADCLLCTALQIWPVMHIYSSIKPLLLLFPCTWHSASQRCQNHLVLEIYSHAYVI